MSIQQNEAQDDSQNYTNTENLSNDPTKLNSNDLIDTELANDEKKLDSNQLNDINHSQGDLPKDASIQEQKNSEKISLNDNDNPKQLQDQASKSSQKNRHLTTIEEKEILMNELKEYLNLPNRTTDRQNKERNVAKKLMKLSPECAHYWDYKKVRDWFNNNNPEKRTKSFQDSEHNNGTRPKDSLGSAPIGFPYHLSGFNSSVQSVSDINNQMYAKQAHSHFVKCYVPNTPTPIISALSSFNTNRSIPSNPAPINQNTAVVQPPKFSSSANSSGFIVPLNSSSALNQLPKNPHILPSLPSNFVSITPYDIQNNFNMPTNVDDINNKKFDKIEENAITSNLPNQQLNALQEHPKQIIEQPSNHIDENSPKSPSSGERICAEIPQNMGIKNSPVKKKTKFRQFFQNEEEKIEKIKRELEQQTPHSLIEFNQRNIGPYTVQQQQMMSTFNASTPTFPLTIHEKYQQQQKQKQLQQQQQQFLPIQQFRQPTQPQISSAIYSTNRQFNNDNFIPNSNYIADFKEPNPKSQFLISSVSKIKNKNKLISDEFDLPLVPEDEVRSFIEKLRSITSARITQLLKIIDERRILIYQKYLKPNSEHRRKCSKNHNEGNKDDNNEESTDYSLTSDEENNNNNNKDKENEPENEPKEKENENNEKDKETSSEPNLLPLPIQSSSSSSEKTFIFTRESQNRFEKKTEERMNELIEFYHNNFGNNQSIPLTSSIGITKESVPPVRLTQQTLIESGEFSPNNKHSSDEKIENIIKERKCIVNFGRNYNIMKERSTRIRVPKEIMKENKKVIKFYRGEFDKKEIIPLSFYDNPTQVESSLFFDNSDDIFYSSYSVQEHTSLFVINDSCIQAPFKRSNRVRSLCKFPHLNNLVLATDGDQLVCINTEEMSTEFTYLIPSTSIKKKHLSKSVKSLSYGTINNKFNINVSGIQHNCNAQKNMNNNNNNSKVINDINNTRNDKVAICATLSEDIIVGKNNHLFFFNRNKDCSKAYDSITLDNMKKVSSICTIEISSRKLNNETKTESDAQAVPLIIVGSYDYPTIYVFNANDHSLVTRLVGHTSGVSYLFGKGRILFSGGVDGSIHKWSFNLIKIDQDSQNPENDSNTNPDQPKASQNDNYAIYASNSLSLFMHSEPIVGLALGKVGNIRFLISCDAHLIRATDLNRTNPSFSISIPEEFEINSLKFDGDAAEINFILASQSLNEFSDRLGIFVIE